MPSTIELVWTYTPTDFFEASYRDEAPEFALLIEGGVVTASLRTSKDSVTPAEQERVGRYVKDLFAVRQFQSRRICDLGALPRIVRRDGAREDVKIQVPTCEMAFLSDAVDTLLCNAADGSVVHDSRAERIARDGAEMKLLRAKAEVSPRVRAMVDAFARSVADPKNEFLHLYEIRDGLRADYGTIPAARNALGIPEAEWTRFDEVTNAAEIERSRHRGRTPVQRPARDEELTYVRKTAREWLRKFAERI